MITVDETRVMELYELQDGCGGGWYECWLRASGDEPEEKYMEPCGYCYGYFVLASGSTGTFEDQYNVPYGVRVWTREPTEAQREATPWDAEDREGE